MRIILEKTLRQFYDRHADARAPLQSWYDHAKNASWNTPEDLALDYSQDVLLPDNRAVFRIKGTNYRLVVKINYHQHTIYIRFIGTHAQYDQIEATKI